MPTKTSITINDAVPTGRVYAPVQSTAERTVLLDRDTNDTSAGAGVLILGYSRATKARPTDRINIRLAMPIEDTVDGVTSVSYTPRFEGDIILPDGMVQSERDDIGALLQNLFADTVVQGYITDLDPMY